MRENPWQANRAGILNYWYYDEAEFKFADGRLLLRGSNGSGKSVTMQSLVTVLLDGVKRADRLDSFGSKSRTMDDYLLGEKEISDYDERTGYLYLEYKRVNSDQYVTTGIGLHARRGISKVDFWGFLLHNGRRIGQDETRDLVLYRLSKNPETGEAQKIPLSRKELENAIGQDGRVTTEQREYMAMVNQYVFGYEDMGKFEELMKLLIQLRSPKLSRDFKPSVIYEILNAALPTLSEEDLRPLAEALENMEKTQLAIEQLKREQGAFAAICKSYTDYNVAVLAERALGAAECQKAMGKLVAQEKNERDKLAQATQEAIAAQKRQQDLTVEAAALREEQSALREHEAYKLAERKKETELRRDKEEQDLAQKEKSLAEKRRRELTLEAQIKAQTGDIAELETQSQEILADMEELATAADFAAHAAFAQGFSWELEAAREYFDLWQKEWRAYGKRLQNLHKALLSYEQGEKQAAALERELGEENRRLDHYRFEGQRLLELLEQAREALVKAFYEWQRDCKTSLPFNKEQESGMSAALRDLYLGTTWLDIQNLLGEAAGIRQRELNAAIGAARFALQGLEKGINAAGAELKRLQETKEATPELSPEESSARDILREMGIPFLPLYEATEYRPQVSPEVQERLESALLAAGLLDALLLKNDEAAVALPESMRGKIIFGGEPVLLAESLADYLEPVPGDSGLSAERITAILSSVAVTDELFALVGKTAVNIRKGAYSLGNIAGRAVERPTALFIGKQARENYRRQQIALKETEITNLKAEWQTRKDEEQRLLQEGEALQTAQGNFPSPKDAQELYDAARSKEKDIEGQESKVREKDEAKKKLALALREDRLKIQSERGQTTLPFAAAAYEEALDALDEYGEEWHRLTHLAADYSHAADLKRQNEAEAAYAAEEVDRLKGEVLTLEMSLAQLDKTLAALTAQLNTMDAEAIEKRVAAVVARLDQIPQELTDAGKKIGDAERLRRTLTAEVERLARQQDVYRQLLEKWQSLIKAEEQRSFPLPDNKPLRQLMQERQKAREERPLHSLAQRVESQYFLHRDEIAEYRFSLRETADELGEMPSLHPDDEALFAPSWRTLKDQALRQLAVTETGGKPLSPYAQMARLKAHLTEQESLLSEQDKKIYQEIIVNSIGRTISDKIYGAEDWIKKMNRLMAKSETSSGLKFRLEWSPKVGEKDTELDTAQLVKLLHGDPNLMKEEDMKRLEEHFVTLIKKAREAAEMEENEADAFQASVKNRLDYRQWFRFKLYYDKGEKIKGISKN
ncbi:MAG: TIGR02680 family protein [Selenomonadaceae bacterium]|nr:TIGR02680 family protein [Selenomonadaceae bacterium]